MITGRRNVGIRRVWQVLETEAEELVAGDQTLGLGWVLTALHGMTEQ